MQAEETEAPPAREANVCLVEAPAEVDAGATMTLRARLACAPARDLRGRALVIRDAEGAEVARAAFTGFDGEVNETGEIALTAPRTTGAHRWTAALAPEDEAANEEEEEDFAGGFVVTVVPHATSLLVWGVPSAITVGTRFTLRAGLKCSSECALGGTRVTIHDQDGGEIAAAEIAEAIWPGSNALRFVEVEIAAPAAAGRQRWEARVAPSEEGLAHAGARASFGVCFVAPPECAVTIEARDAASGAPIRGAKVVMHPFRVQADAEGIARLQVPKGSYRVYVSAPRFEAVTCDVEVAGDLATRAELIPEPPEDLARGYT